MTDGQLNDAERLEIIKAILAEPVPRWFQNAHRRANSYAEQLRRIAEVAGNRDGASHPG
ncbi:MAG: hypothetical protein ACRDVG_14110 [Jatrophihabitantaceae bacterium]